MYFGNVGFYYTNLTLGDHLIVYRGGQVLSNCRFIKVTRKGFNILNIDTNRCLLKRHLYAKGMGNCEFPKSGKISGLFLINAYTRVEKK